MDMNLLERMVLFSGLILKITRTLSEDYEGSHMRKQLVRSNTSTSLNYAEAMGGESRKDFIHKMNIALKELRESFMNMKIIRVAELSTDKKLLDKGIDECNQLISIFVASVNTAKRNNKYNKNN